MVRDNLKTLRHMEENTLIMKNDISRCRLNDWNVKCRLIVNFLSPEVSFLVFNILPFPLKHLGNT